VRDLRYRFPEIEARLHEGEEIEITKRKRAIAELVPLKIRRRKGPPDFMPMLRQIYGNKVSKVTGAQIVSEQREPYWPPTRIHLREFRAQTS
jgi:antitoxin (DNA-binding transcriptional repressor) of toxin-antitoxin stability system